MGRFKILVVSAPVAIGFLIAKVIFHAAGLEPVPASFTPVFTAMVTGIIFLLGFQLAGVLADYKESERIPGEMAASLHAIWQETEIALAANPSSAPVRSLRARLAAFVDVFREDMLLKRNGRAFEVVDGFTADFAGMDKEVAANLMGRLRNEQSNLRRLLVRIRVIRDTEYAASVSLLVRWIIILYCCSLLLLRFEPGSVGSFFVFFYSFVLFSILRAISDMEDPFEYEEPSHIDAPVDEIDFFPVFDLGREFRRRLGAREE